MLMMHDNLTVDVCDEREHIAAYLDGELDAALNAAFECHIKTCVGCRSELIVQRRLLCVLDAAIRADKKEMLLPHDFARTVTARAQTDMRGLRNRAEQRRAFVLCGALVLIVIAFIGATAFENVWSSVTAIMWLAFGILSSVAQALLVLLAGFAVVLRVIGSFLLASSQIRGAFTLLTLGIAAVALLHLLFKNNRLAGGTETESF
jgi:anti-sigma factor RsiW